MPITTVYADSANPNDVLTSLDGKVTAPGNTDGLQTMAGKVIGAIQVVSVILAAVLIAVFGFKFILGSAQEKSDYMKSFIPLIIGVVVVFSAVSIAKLIFSIA